MSPATFDAAHYAVQKYKALKEIKKHAETLHTTQGQLETIRRAVRVAQGHFDCAMEELCTTVEKGRPTSDPSTTLTKE